MTLSDDPVPGNSPSPYRAGLACRCPRCGKGRLFDGFLTFRSSCTVCGLQYSFADAGDGPAIFVILIAGCIVVGAALVTEIKYEAPFWVHALLWGPLNLAMTLGPLRGLKGLLTRHRRGDWRQKAISKRPCFLLAQPCDGPDVLVDAVLKFSKILPEHLK